MMRQVLSLVDESLKYTSASSNASVIQSIKVARALRPLRVLSRFEGLKFLGRVTGAAFGMIMRAAFLSSMALFAFGDWISPFKRKECSYFSVFYIILSLTGILGQQLYSGKMNTCSDSLIFQRRDCIGHIPFSNLQRSWLTYLNNFGISF